ncbi:hypothetical protein K439DRAFT_1372247, partial [Ramaria rubella]
IPDSLWIDVLLDRFIDLDKSIPAHIHSTLMRTHGEWIIAFSTLKDAILFAYPHHAKVLEDYQCFIIRKFAALQETSLHSHVINLNHAI